MLDRPSNFYLPHCPTINSSSEICETKNNLKRQSSQQNILAALGPWDLNSQKKGITHRLIDVEGRYSDIYIGTPRGPKPIMNLKIYGTEVSCLADAGAEVSLIAKECLQSIVEKAKLHRESMRIHTPVFQECRAANESIIQFIAAVTLPVTRGDLDSLDRAADTYNTITSANSPRD